MEKIESLRWLKRKARKGGMVTHLVQIVNKPHQIIVLKVPHALLILLPVKCTAELIVEIG